MEEDDIFADNQVVAVSLHARILGEGSTIHSLPTLFS